MMSFPVFNGDTPFKNSCTVKQLQMKVQGKKTLKIKNENQPCVLQDETGFSEKGRKSQRFSR